MPNVWISGDVVLFVKPDGSKMVTIENLAQQQSPGLPKGPEVNAALADPTSTLRREVEKVWNNGGEIEIGQMRVLNGGGAYTLPANMLDLTCEDGSHEALWSKLSQKLGGEPETATPVVFRGWGAPGTYGVFDGGGAGRGEVIPRSSQQFLLRNCLGENLGEIGLLAHLPDGTQGRIDYRFANPFDLGSGATQDPAPRGWCGGEVETDRWLNHHVTEEWQRAHGSVPLALARATVQLLPLTDELRVEHLGSTGRDVKLAIEWHSASVECLTLSKLTFHKLPAGTRLRFIDLESRGGKGLNRRIGIVLRRGDKLAAVAYKGGVFDHDFPMIPVCEQTLAMCGNEKFKTVVEMTLGQ